MKTVAVTMRVVSAAGYDEPRDALSHDWVRYLAGLGLRPVLVPNGLDDPLAYAASFAPSALLLTNGNDVGFCKARDRTEGALVDWALERDLPVLGVCRGLQFVNVHLCGGLCRDLAGAGFPGHVAKEHAVRTDDGKTFSVNSFHEQGVREKDLAPGLSVFARSPDGLVEGVRLPGKRLVAIQWHPERPHAGRHETDRIVREALGL